MNSWTVKTFFKSKAVILVIHYPNKRVKEFWVLPNKDDLNTATVAKDNTRYIIDTEKVPFSIRSGVPLFTYKHNEAKPINILKDTHSAFLADEIEAMAQNKIVKEFNRAVNRKGITDWAFYAFLAIIGMGAIIIYMISQNGGVISG
ncbi:MAG: hypothetical protein QXI16_00485 [Sulfolobaceae archaeon]